MTTLFHHVGRHAGAFEGGFDGGGAQVRRRHVFERAAEPAHGRPGSADDDCVLHVSLLEVSGLGAL